MASHTLELLLSRRSHSGCLYVLVSPCTNGAIESVAAAIDAYKRSTATRMGLFPLRPPILACRRRVCHPCILKAHVGLGSVCGRRSTVAPPWPLARYDPAATPMPPAFARIRLRATPNDALALPHRRGIVDTAHNGERGNQRRRRWLTWLKCAAAAVRHSGAHLVGHEQRHDDSLPKQRGRPSRRPRRPLQAQLQQQCWCHHRCIAASARLCMERGWQEAVATCGAGRCAARARIGLS